MEGGERWELALSLYLLVPFVRVCIYACQHLWWFLVRLLCSSNCCSLSFLKVVLSVRKIQSCIDGSLLFVHFPQLQQHWRKIVVNFYLVVPCFISVFFIEMNIVDKVAAIRRGMASTAAEFHLDTAVRQVADGIAKILLDGNESIEMNFLVDLCDLSRNILLNYEQRLKRSERNNLYNLGANLFNACQNSKDRTASNTIVTAKLALYCLSCQQLDVPLAVQLMEGWTQTGIDASAGGVHFSPDAKECFYQSCDLFFNKLTLDEAPRVIPGAKLDQTYQIAFNACSGLVKAELDMLASSGSQENVTKHEESIQTTVLWIFELQRFMQPLETSQNEIELALLLGKVGIVMKHLDLLNHAVRYFKQAVQASGLIRSSKVDAKSFKIKAIHNLAECHLQVDPKECLITLGMSSAS